MAGLTLDAGALIGVEEKKTRVLAELDRAFTARSIVTVPTAVIAEVWRSGSRSAIIAKFLKQCDIEPLTLPLARQAGELMTRTGRRSVVDAIVVVSAAQRGDDIVTQDLGASMRILADAMPNVRIVSVQ